MNASNFQEDNSSKLPALRLLINSGYTFLSHEEEIKQRFQKSSNVLLEPILNQQLSKINEIKVSSTQTEKFSEANLEEAIRRLKEIPMEQGYIAATEYVYELLTLGTTLSQTIEGNKREYTLQFIDWKHPENNVFHVIEEFSVSVTDGSKDLRPDIVLFVNGIPLCVIENKREDIKEPLKEAISQHTRNQQEDKIRKLYVYAQILIAAAVSQIKYGTNGTKERFWSHWREKEISPLKIDEIKSKPLNTDIVSKLIKARSSSPFFSKQEAEKIETRLTQSFVTTEQDRVLFSIASPKRLLQLIYSYILYDAGIKKIARYQQFFGVKNALSEVQILKDGKRQGGVIWHTQGSGKSLTMALLAQAIAREESIKNPKIILVTDRTSLDTQITRTFKNVGLDVLNATTGKNLIEILEGKKDAVITTIINKFETAVKGIKSPLTSPNIFVLVDEGHRTQYGSFNINMQKTLPNACFIAFTGTPLFKKDKSTVAKFGIMIDKYTVKQAVADGAVLPLVYEGRHSIQKVNNNAIDNYFKMVAEDLSEYEQADLKKKFSARSHIADADQNIYAIAWDISKHYQENFQGTCLKGQVVCSTKSVAVKYLDYLKQIGKVGCALVISPPDDREGEETAYGETSDSVKKFWKEMMDQYGNSKRYEESIIQQFKEADEPELIIVVDKLLTGFDAPRNAVLYLTRKLKGHTLLQAIARVNRVYTDKDYGYIIDYAGVVEELDNALITYSDLDSFDEQDLEGTLVSINEEIQKLEPAHQALLDIFKEITNHNDVELYQRQLRQRDVRDNFYKRLAVFARILKLALSSMDFHNNTPKKTIDGYKDDFRFFMNLRTIVGRRYSDKVDYSQYEGQIQKLVDQHLSTSGVEKLTDLVNIFDEDAFQKELEKTIGTAAKADKIASRTAKHITEKLEEDPAFYKRFSQLIQQTIDDFYAQRISELEYLKKMQEYQEQVLSKTDSKIPESLKENKTASAYFGILNTFYEEEKKISSDPYTDILVVAALKIEEIIQSRQVVNWKNNPDIIKKMSLEIGDYIYDHVRDQIDAPLNFSEIDRISEEIINVAKARL